jgi:DNA-binding NarL/FixJ family response regulator
MIIHLFRPLSYYHFGVAVCNHLLNLLLNPFFAFTNAKPYSMSQPIRIVIADDHNLVRSGIVKLLNEHEKFTVLSEAENGKQAIEQCEIVKPDVLLLDLDMPVMNGLEAMPIVREKMPDIKIGILTMHKEKSLVEKLIKMGVNGYLYKSSEPEDLIYGVSQIAQGKSFYSSEVTENLVSSQAMFKSASQDQLVLLAQLSDREKEITSLIAEGMSNTEIGEKLFISARTVDTHRANIMKKLEIKNLAGLIRFAISSGLVH